MDVTCDNCKAEYDFDDTLLGDKGTTVKCSKCGHVFRVMPPRREPTRSALKVRYRDGRIEAVASLRDLQQRIQAGQIGIDDELGRDGFNYRRLGDVPELRNFFGRSVPASGSVPSAAIQAAKNDLPHRGEPLPPKAAPKRTVLGIGSADIPGAPRVPNFGPLAAAQALAPTQPSAEVPRTGSPKSTLQGRAPISSAPTAPNTSIPAQDAQSRADAFDDGAPTATHTAPTQPASAGYGASAAASTGSPSGTAPTQIAPPAGNGSHALQGAVGSIPARPAADGTPVRPIAGGSTAPVAQRPAGPALRLSESAEGPMRSDGHQPPRSHGLDSIAPGALKAAAGPQSGSGRPAAGKAVRLSVEEEDQLPERERSGGGARWLLYLVAAGVLGGGAFFAARQLNPAPAPATPELTAARVENPATLPAPEASTMASTDAGAETAAAPAPAAEAKPEQPASAPSAAAAPAPAPSPAASEKPKAPEPSASKSAEKPSTSNEKSGASEGSSTREPKDYAGWVTRGDQLLAKHDYPGAQQAFQTAVSLRGTGSEANSGLGAALVAQGQTREAVPYLTRAANNGFAEASVTLGDAYRKLGDKDAAIEAYETYLARLPKGARANYVRLQLEGLGKDTGGAKAEPAPAREPESRPPPSTEYRPAGEMVEPAPAPAAESPQ